MNKLPAGVKQDWILRQHVFGEFMSTIVSESSNVMFHSDVLNNTAIPSYSYEAEETKRERDKGFLNTHAVDGDRTKVQDERKRRKFSRNHVQCVSKMTIR